MNEIRVKLDSSGRLVVPASFRKAMGVGASGEVIMRLEEGEVHLYSLEHALEKTWKAVRKHVPEGDSLTEELIAQRRAEAGGD